MLSRKSMRKDLMKNEAEFKKNEKLGTIPCHYPWSSVYVSPNGDVRHCCATNLTKLGNLSEQPINEIWNGELFQKVRKKVAKGDFDGAYCNSNCEGLRTGVGYPWVERTKGTMEIEKNEAVAITNFENKAEKVDHLPTQLHIEFSDNCNFRCIMCFYEFKPPYHFIPDHVVTQLLEMSRFATHVILMGGEVFMNKNDLKFIDDYESQEGAWMGFVTNASCLSDEMIERIKKFKRIGMLISIDGTEKEVFEKVRIRGKWEEVDANIHRVVQAANDLREHGYEWRIELAYVVMGSNLSNLAHAIEYAFSLRIPIDFNPVKGFHLFKENIFVYKDALAAAGNWRSYLEAAFNTLERHRANYEHYDRVLVRLQDIEQFLQKPKIRLHPVIIKIVKILVPGKDGVKAQGLAKHDRYVGHLIEVYYNWLIGNSSLRSTLSYLTLKTFRMIKGRLS